MVDFLLVLLGGIGMTLIVVDGSIFDSWRIDISDAVKPEEKGIRQWFIGKLNKIVNCHQCAGFWCGAVAYLIWLAGIPVLSHAILVGCAVSAFSMLVRVAIDYLDKP